MLKCELDKNNFIQYRENTWDSKVFLKNVYEILEVKVDNSHENELIEAFISTLSSNRENILITVRVKANQENLVKIFQKYNFEIVEMSYSLFIRNLQKVNLGKYKKRIELIKMEEKHLNAVQQISVEAFYYSRYHLDKALPVSQIKQRNKNWVNDMFRNNTFCDVYVDKNEVVSFVFYEINSETATLLLGGSKEGKGFFTPLVWNALLIKFQEMGIKQVKTIIQTNNLGSLKLHLNFSFEIDSIFYGLNKHI